MSYRRCLRLTTRGYATLAVENARAPRKERRSLDALNKRKSAGEHDESAHTEPPKFYLKRSTIFQDEDTSTSRPRSERFAKLEKIGHELKACTSLEEVKKLHASFLDTADEEIKKSLYLANTLVAMYSAYGDMGEARLIFDKLSEPRFFSWNAVIRGYIQAGESEAALELFEQMQKQGVVPDSRLFVLALKTSAGLASKESGKLIDGQVIKEASLKRARALHTQAQNAGHESNIFVANTILDMYAKCGCMKTARKVFERMGYQDSVSWNTIITGYSQNGESEVALELFKRMQSEEFKPDARTYLAAVNACGSLAHKGKSIYLETGRAIHSKLAKDKKLEEDVFLTNGLIDMYAKFGDMFRARKVFDKMKKRTSVSWNAIVMGYAQAGEGEQAFKYFELMKTKGFTPDARTYVGALQACCCLAVREEGKHDENGKLVKKHSLEKGRAVHSELKKSRVGSNIFVANSLVDMYSKCGSLADARLVFDNTKQRDIALWNVMIMGYAQNGEGDEALALFSRMQAGGKLVPNVRTYAAAVTACASLACKEPGTQVDGRTVKVESLSRGKKLHSQVSKAGFELNVFVASSLVEMYVKCAGGMVEARAMFEKMEERSASVWNSMILGYAQGGEKKLALEIFKRMKDEGYTPDAASYAAALKACDNVEDGNSIVAEIKKAGVDKNTAVANSLAWYRLQNVLKS